MVDGIGSVAGATTTSNAELVAALKTALTEILETNKSGGTKIEESKDEESGITEEKTPTKPKEDATSTGLMSLLTSLTSMLGSLMQTMLEALGIKKGETNKPADDTENPTAPPDKDTYKMTENEKAYLTLNPNFVKNLMAQEKGYEKYPQRLSLPGKLPNVFRENYIAKMEKNITDEEVQAYLQLHPNTIKDAISGKSVWDIREANKL